MFAYQNYNQTIYWPIYCQTYNTTASNVDPPPNPRRMKKVFAWRKNRENARPIPPVLLELCTKERYPKPLVVRLVTVEWCARRLAARRRHLPLRSRPGVR